MTVVVGYIPTPEGEAALQQGIEEARRRSLTLVVLNSSRGDALVDERFARGEALEILQRRLSTSGVSFEIRQAEGRDVADEVASVAAETSASLVVIGLRRRSPVGKLVLGSAAQRILMEAPCPVLAVKSRRARS